MCSLSILSIRDHSKYYNCTCSFHNIKDYFKRFTYNNCTKMTMNPATKQKIAIILNVSKTVFHWGFIPAILFLG